jgi:TolB-like protein
MSLFEELKRRNVFRVAITYIILAWLMAQVAELLLETFGAPDWVLKSLLAMFLIGFPFALFFAWAFELTPDGLKKEKDVDRGQSIASQTGHKLDRTIIAVLVVALGYFAWDRFASAPVDIAGQTAATGQSISESDDDSTLPTDKSIAVLPFDNRSSQTEDEYFTTGIHDDLLTQLAQISSLRVISRTSVAQFKDTSKSIREIAELLGVATILEGGVQRAGNQVRINMQLIDAATDAHLWAQTYDRELTANNIFAIQSEIATAVTLAMRATLSPEEQTRIADVPTQNMEALEEYFKGRAELDQRTVPSIESARMRFERARQLDAGFALALAGEALAIMLLSDGGSSYGDIPEIESNAMARPLLETALQLAPDDPQVLAVFGLLKNNEEDVETAIDYYDRSLALNPSSGEVLNWQRMALSGAGRMKEARQVNMRMIEVDPMSMITLYNGILGLVGTADEDEQQVETLLQRLDGLNHSFGLNARASVARNRGDLPTAVKLYYQVLELDPGRSSNRSSLALLLAFSGFGKEAAKVAPDWAYNVPFFNTRWQEAIDIHRDRYQHDPSITNASSLLSALAMAGDAEAAFPLAQEIWSKTGSNSSQLGFTAMTMVWVAMKTEHLAEARMYRDAAARFVQSLIEAEITTNFRYNLEAQLAALDGRQVDAVTAITTALNKGGMRWHNALQTPYFESLQDDPDFQAQVARHRDLVDANRQGIVALLCGPGSILTTWEPAPETCQ